MSKEIKVEITEETFEHLGYAVQEAEIVNESLQPLWEALGDITYRAKTQKGKSFYLLQVVGLVMLTDDEATLNVTLLPENNTENIPEKTDE